MPDPYERFIELALRPLAGKSPAEDLARGELMERLNHSRPGPGDDSLEAATARLEGPGGRLWNNGKQVFLLLLVFTVVLGAMSFASWRELVRMDYLYHLLPHEPDHLKAAERELEATVADDQRLFLFANSQMMGEKLREDWRKGYQASLPSDPALLEEYVVQYGFGDGPQRERILEQARRIDTGNGFWDLREAGVCIARSKFKYSNSKPPSGYGPAFPALQTDEAYDEAVALMAKAVSAPRFETRIPSNTARRLEMLGRATNLAEVADRLMFAEDQRGGGSYPNRWQNLWQARMEELARKQDREGLREWFETLERLVSRCLKESGDKRFYNPGGLVSLGASRISVDLLRRFDLNDEADRWAYWAGQIRKPSSNVSVTNAEEISRKASAFTRVSYYSSGAFVYEGELEPGRRAEHAMADRMLAISAAILFGVLAWLAGLEGWRRGQPVRGLAGGVGTLLGLSDFAWICGLGIVIPAAWHMAVAGISPLGCRDYRIDFEDMKPIALRAGGSFLFAACMLVQSARWRLAKRGGLLGLRPTLWQGWAIAVIAALFVPAMGAARYCPPKWQEEFINYGSAAAGLPLLWLLWRSFALILSPRRVALPGVIVCRALVPCFVSTGLVLMAAGYLLEREESEWVQRDTLAHFYPDGIGMPVATDRLVQALRSQMLHALETAPGATK
ncbi:hypothetical protein [Luteolibacter soli]|uniref:Uncharacterized protein n=1 Tax=Luteolibacter soli TaxID=3135280 RepID=A0ABU9AMP9_9BACT